MKLSGLIVEQNKIYSSKGMNDVTSFQNFHLSLMPERAATCVIFKRSLVTCQNGLPDYGFLCDSQKCFPNPLDDLFQYWRSSRSFCLAQTAFLVEFFVPCSNLRCSWYIFREFSEKCTLHSLFLNVRAYPNTRNAFSVPGHIISVPA